MAVFFMACTVVLPSCSKYEFITPDDPQSQLENFTVSVSSAATKTYIMPSDSGKYAAMWNSDDKLQIYIDELSASAGYKYVLTNNVAGRTATFLGSVGSNSGQHTIYGFYPSEALVSGSDSYDGDFVLSVDLPSRQKPTLTSFDPLCDILAVKPIDVTFTESHSAIIPDAEFSRKIAIVKLVPKDLTTGKMLSEDIVAAVKMTAASSRVLTGRAQLNLETSEIEKWTYQSANNTVGAYYKVSDSFNIDGTNAAFLMVAPGTLPSADTVAFEIYTDRHLLKKRVVLPSDIVMNQGVVTVLNVSLTDTCVLAAGDNLPLEEDFASALNGDNTTTGGCNTLWNGNENFPTVRSAYQAGKAVKLGTGKVIGSMTTKALNLSSSFTVSFKVKGWKDAGKVVVSCGSQSKTVDYTNTMTGSWESASVSFFGESSVEAVTFSTTSDSKRCYIDDVSITAGKEEDHEILVSTEQLTIGASSASSSKFTVIADYDWTAAPTDGSFGFSVSPSSGVAQKYVDVTVTSTQANPDSLSRLLGGVKITDGVATTIVSVFQAASSGPVSTGWAELPSPTTGENLETCHHDKLPSDSKKRNYSFLYDKEKHCALWVAWPLHSCYLGNADRTNAFDYDPVFIENKYEPNISSAAYWPKGGSSYSHSRGHQLPSADRTFSTEDNQTTFYSTNMTPQLQNFNGGVWVQLEEKERKSYICSDTLYIVSGPYFDPDQTPTYTYDNKGAGKACQVPTHYWKIFLRTKSGKTGKSVKDCTAAELQCVGFWFSHDRSSGQPLVSDLRSVAQIEALTGFTFFPNVPNAPKSSFSASDWGL